MKERGRRLCELADLCLDAGSLLLPGELGGLVLQALGLPLLLALLGAGILVLLERVLADGSVGVGVHLLELAGIEVVLKVLAELALVALLVVVGKTLHVLGNVTAEDVLAQSLGIELLAFDVVAGKAALGVGHEDTTVRGTLHGSEDTGTGGGTVKTDVEDGLEGAAGALVGLGGLGQGELTIWLLDTGEVLVQAELLQGAAGKQETSGVGGRPVGEAVLDAIALELVGVGAGKNLVAGDLSGDDLGDDVAVGEADDQAVLGRVVLVLSLGDETLAGVVVGLALATALELRLEATVQDN